MKIFLNRTKILISIMLSTSIIFLMEVTGPFSFSQHTSNSMWDSIGRELNLDHETQSPEVQAEIHKLLADQGKLYSILKSAGPYIYFIHQQTEKRHLPAELALIPVIESEFNPNDHSKKGATGLWQLMPTTARELGIQVKSNYDGRRSVVASTKAALAYFNDLGNLFKGNWFLAIAAYNCGQGLVKNVEHKTGSDSFWRLPLPKETREYVPKLLAVAAIVKDPEKYGVQLPHIDDAPYFTELAVTKSVDLNQVAKNSNVSTETMHTLNPDYNKGSSAPSKGTYTLLVPTKEAPQIKTALAAHDVEA